MDEFTKEGRKLRPRKSTGASGARTEKVDFSSSERRSYSEGGERRSYGENRGSGSYGQRRSYGEGGERRSYGEGRSYGSGERRNFNNGERKSYGSSENRGSYNNGERRSYGSSEGRGGYNRGGSSYGNGERRSYGESNGEQRENRGNWNSNRGTRGESRSNFSDRRNSEGRSNFSGGYNRTEGGSYGQRRTNGGKPGFKRSNFGDKPGYGSKPYGRKSNPAFSKDSSDGINRMINRHPVVNGAEYSDEDTFETPIKNEVRLNKFIANSGVCSRREADTLIQAGVVTVNGEVVTELGTKVNIYEDDIRFNGERLKGEEKTYIVMNKPKGYVTTASDPHADKTVLDLVKGCSARVYPVGRLDKNTTGVLMLTNDGEIAERLTHPSYDKKKIYQVALDRELSQEDYDAILSGITLSDGEVKADELEYIDQNDKRKLGIEIHSGKNRIVRRIFESMGYTVRALDRVYFAGLTKKGLKKGGWRYLTEGEVNILKMGAYV